MSDEMPPSVESSSKSRSSASSKSCDVVGRVAWWKFEWRLSSRRLRSLKLLIEASLPEQAGEVVWKVVKNHWLGLTLGEREVVAGELIEYFQEAAGRGVSVEEAVGEFGSVKAAVRRIRRKKISERWWLWRWAWRVQMALSVSYLLGVFLLVMTYLFFLVRLIYSEPTIKVDYVARLNAEVAAVAVENRAWPIYREVLLELGDFRAVLGKAGEWVAPNDLPEFLDAHQAALERLRVAVGKKSMGFLIEDEVLKENEAIMKPILGRMHFYLYRFDGRLQSGYWPLHGEALRDLADLLGDEFELALERGDGNVLERDIDVLMAIGDQLDFGNYFVIEQMQRWGFVGQGSQMICEVLVDEPGLLSDAALGGWLKQLGAMEGLESIPIERDWIDDALQRNFTDDGNGGGHLANTAPGMFYFEPLDAESADESMMERVDRLMGLAFASMMAPSRRSITERLDRFEALDQAYVADPMWLRREKPYLAEPFYTWDDDYAFWDIPGHMFSMTYMSFPDGSWHKAEIRDTTLMQIDATRVAIGLELYRRKNGGYPDDLEGLVPEWLDSVPLDLIVGRPMLYRLVEGDDGGEGDGGGVRPLVYSVGADHDDDGGRLPIGPDGDPDPHSFRGRHLYQRAFPDNPIPDGDWVLYPWGE